MLAMSVLCKILLDGLDMQGTLDFGDRTNLVIKWFSLE